MKLLFSAVLLFGTISLFGLTVTGNDKPPAIRLVNKSLDRWAACESVTVLKFPKTTSLGADLKWEKMKSAM